ncbi:MAG: universal stress protein [Actinomycetota bacterium]|nr:universal stress protein [Actinomycetota bacterium]
MGRIVVGVDSSKTSLKALRWAIAEAELRGAGLMLVHAFPRPELVGMTMVVTLPSDDELREASEQVLDDALAAAGGAGETAVTKHVGAGGPASVLVEVAKDAELLVLGSRGLGGFRGMLLGSVTQQVIAHAPCPVVVITSDKD